MKLLSTPGARRLALSGAALVTLLALNGCGGGGGDSGDANGSLPGGSTPPPTTATGTCGLNNFQQEMLDRVNAIRTSGAICGSNSYGATAALTWNTTLAQAADAHAKDMAAKDYFDHVSQDGTTMGERVTRAGYTWSTVGENIAAGQSSVQEVVTAWRNSPGHCANLMSPNFRHVAVSCQAGVSGGATRNYWVMNLASPR